MIEDWIEVEAIEARMWRSRASARRDAAGRCTVVSSLGTTEGGHIVGAKLSDRLCKSILLAGAGRPCETSKSGG